MTSKWRGLYVLSTVFLVGLVVFSYHRPEQAWGSDTESAASWSPAAAQQYLDTRAHWWHNWGGAARGHGTACLSCHTSMPIGIAEPSIEKQLGQTVAGAEETALIEGVTGRVNSWDTIVGTRSAANDPCVCYYPDTRPASLGTEAVLNALVLVNYDDKFSHGILSQTTQTALTYFWDEQQPDGSWQWLDFGLSPWEKDGAYYGTALAAVAVGMAGKDYYDRPDLASKIAAMKNYLAARYASRPLHDRVACLWASTWLPGILTETQKQLLIQQIDGTQETDGGWSLPHLGLHDSGSSDWHSQGMFPNGAVSDGYASGLVVLALKRAGVSGANPSLQRGVLWLKSNEVSGSWPADYINQARDPQSDVGGFMRDASTSFAVLALTESERH